MVSMIQLVATPERFQGKLVRVMGFCRFESEGDALYMHHEDFERTLTMNAVRLAMDEPGLKKYRRLTDMYVFVVGRFTPPDPKTAYHYAGKLSEIRQIVRLPSRDEFTAGHGWTELPPDD